MVMKQSLNAGTLDNISCIFICFNNFNQTMLNKFYANNLNSNNASQNKKIVDDNLANLPYDIKSEYAASTLKEPQLNHNIFEEIRRRITYIQEVAIQLKRNEVNHLSNSSNKYDNSRDGYSSNNFNENIFKRDINYNTISSNNINNFNRSKNNFSLDKKPKTSSETIKNLPLEFMSSGYSRTNEIDYAAHKTLNTDSNTNNDIDKFLYKIVSKKIKTPAALAPSYKNYESTLPTFKISQRINKPTKESNIKNYSPTNNRNENKEGNSNYINNTNNPIKNNNNKFLPNINKHVGNFHTANPNNYNERSSTLGFKYTKPLQYNFNLNK